VNNERYAKRWTHFAQPLQGASEGIGLRLGVAGIVADQVRKKHLTPPWLQVLVA